MPAFAVDAAELHDLATSLGAIGQGLHDRGQQPPLGALAGSHAVALSHEYLLRILAAAGDELRGDLERTANALSAASGAYEGTDQRIADSAATTRTGHPKR